MWALSQHGSWLVRSSALFTEALTLLAAPVRRGRVGGQHRPVRRLCLPLWTSPGPSGVEVASVWPGD